MKFSLVIVPIEALCADELFKVSFFFRLNAMLFQSIVNDLSPHIREIPLLYGKDSDGIYLLQSTAFKIFFCLDWLPFMSGESKLFRYTSIVGRTCRFGFRSLQKALLKSECSEFGQLLNFSSLTPLSASLTVKLLAHVR